MKICTTKAINKQQRLDYHKYGTVFCIDGHTVMLTDANEIGVTKVGVVDLETGHIQEVSARCTDYEILSVKLVDA